MAPVPGFETTQFAFGGKTRDVFTRGAGPAVIVIHEVPGITPQVAAFGARVAEAGFTVYLPLLFGVPMKPLSMGYVVSTFARCCISREFRVLAANASSPIVDWLRALAAQAHSRCGGPGVGAVGMCLTGNFALAMMLDSPMLAPVLSQPSLPLPITSARRKALHVSATELAAAHRKIEEQKARILGLRFHQDPACPPQRFETLRQEFGTAFEGIEIDPKYANPSAPKPAHSVLTNHLIDEAGQPTRAALDRTIAFLREQLMPAA
ncbi:MAG TPA: dienelactone hydrolase family protein [Candidatus Binataceae bacterium]|nr:dienelactone hydrolase family protein [Candidatus Binataceae bacterium]